MNEQSVNVLTDWPHVQTRDITAEKPIIVLDLKQKPYQPTLELQRLLHRRRIKGSIGDHLLLVEHEPVYTFGKNADRNHLLQSHPPQAKLFFVERGGDVTFHGPGQLVGYPILDLRQYRKSVSWYIRTLEAVLIRTLERFGITADVRDEYPGVWVEDEKIAALGVRISRWVTMHGFALNVNTDLTYFDGIIPCGIFECGVTSMKALIGHEVDFLKVKNVLSTIFLETFQSQKTVGVN
ncbi:MAG: lipoyl(octanoyl) transferase LipB [Fidelibacterota bacterium]